MITVTEKAARELKRRLESHGPTAKGIRLGVKAGGCSGMEYVMKVEDEPKDNDKVFDCNDVKLFIDWKSYMYLNGITIDYNDDLMNAHFVFDNPNAVRSCGCGTSFATG